MTKNEFIEWAKGRGFTPEGAISGIGNWTKGRGESLGKGDRRYVLQKTQYVKEMRPMGKFTRWQKVACVKYEEVCVGQDGKLVRG